MRVAKPELSMIRSYTWADLLTLANASCGTVSIFACLSFIAGDQSRWLWTAFVLPVVVAVLAAVYAWFGRRYVGRVTAPGGS